MKERTNLRAFLEAAASPQHQALVRCLISKIEEDGFKILTAAGVRGFSAPEPIQGFIPDLKGHKTGLNAYGEAERCEELTSEHTMNQIKAFSGRTMNETGANVPLYLGVSENCCEGAQEFVTQNWPNSLIIVVCCQ